MSDGDSPNMDSAAFARRMRTQPAAGPVGRPIDSVIGGGRRVQPRPENMAPLSRQINDFRPAPGPQITPATRQIRQPMAGTNAAPTPRQQLHLQSNPRTSAAVPVAASLPPQPAPQPEPLQPTQPVPQFQPPQQPQAEQFAQPAQAQQAAWPPVMNNQLQSPPPPPPPPFESQQAKQPSIALKAGMVGIAVLVFLTGMGVSLNTLRQNKQAQAQLAELTKEADQQKSDESTKEASSGAVLGSTTTAPSATFNVLPDQPKTLIIPKIQLNTLAQPVAVNEKGLINLPSDSKNVGWYSSSAKPGEIPTAMVFNGLIGATTQAGPFYQLDKIVVGDSVQVIRGDGQVYNYKVVKTTAYDPNTQNTGSLLSPAKPGVPSLVLISTKTETSSPTAQSIAVYAEQI